MKISSYNLSYFFRTPISGRIKNKDGTFSTFTYKGESATIQPKLTLPKKPETIRNPLELLTDDDFKSDLSLLDKSTIFVKSTRSINKTVFSKQSSPVSSYKSPTKDAEGWFTIDADDDSEIDHSSKIPVKKEIETTKFSHIKPKTSTATIRNRNKNSYILDEADDIGDVICIDEEISTQHIEKGSEITDLCDDDSDDLGDHSNVSNYLKSTKDAIVGPRNKYKLYYNYNRSTNVYSQVIPMDDDEDDYQQDSFVDDEIVYDLSEESGSESVNKTPLLKRGKKKFSSSTPVNPNKNKKRRVIIESP